MVAAAALLLGVMHAMVGMHYRQSAAYIVFAVLAIAVAALAAMELLLMKQSDPAVFGRLIRQAHIPSTIIALALPIYLRLRLGKRHTFLFAAAVGSRLLAVVLNFAGPQSLAWREVRSTQTVDFLGSQVSVAGEVVPNTWRWVGAVSLLFLALYVFAVWFSHLKERRDRNSILMASGYASWILLATGTTWMINYHIVELPYVISVSVLPLFGCIAWELSREILRVASIASRLQEQTADMELAARVARLAHWNWDMKEGIIHASGIGRELYGLSGEGGVRFEEFIASVHEADRAGVRAAISEAEASGWLHTEYRLRESVRPGQATWVLACGQIEYDQSGRPHYMRGLSMDIGQRKAAEAEARARREEVARLSRVGALGEISGSLAHELNQPLSAILNNAESARRLLVREPPDTREAAEACADVITSTLRAREVILRLRAFLERGETSHAFLEPDVIVREVLHMLASELRERGVTVEFSPGQVPGLCGDRVQLQQVLLNLFLNAAEAMHEQPACTRCLRVVTAVVGERVEIQVADSGRGVPGSDQDIFAPFVTTKPHGLGMGLAVCRSIARAHGGDVSCMNAAEGGAIFTVTLPISATPNSCP